MDEDVAYLLGMIMARGSFIETEEKRRLIIEFPYRNLDTRAPIKSGINYFPLFETYEIQVDITAIIIKRNTADLAFVEFKTNYLCLKDIGQLLGYCRVALPKFAFLLSPKGPGRNLTKLIDTYGRTDILQYNSNDFIRLAEWNASAGAIETLSVLPMGSHISLKNK